ncbi:tetratricopeptide repeat protein [Psychroserpens sp.]|uniref:tetratricopeptide repeat protein n=1 Tax=Psychroserpens sp. TaxID=2020870 RepID=UPI001B2985AF|nr:tetratricopeptide repeat protein [Psychroserpens sp.]MBO6607699.1 tetratricopeptide repeat protein [Psychroserpens sp.]MBO6630091.1 tetratricopeptide repeat protein [Psychroserpens sp.]MBO6654690.1 tetratricopeptide repeat protein [Psychroserpens sp.]MBO6682886.1 tetratricopeptide repeat protein [Psychroserpens sp.]MBO6751057.1 tetratricopeptide repeat protein [Psychroserpens sp.]
MRTLIYIFSFFCCVMSFGQNMTGFENANALYNEGNYTEAIEQYQRILDTDVHSAELYFNLANAHYKLNHIAPSIYYYEKALLLDPNDKDIQNNLAYARNMTIDAIEIIPEVGFTRLLNNATNTLSYDNWAILAVCLVVVFVVLFLSYYFSRSSAKKRFAFIISGLCILLAMISVAFAFHRYELTVKDQPAIVFAQEAQIKTEPNLRSIEAFKLHEGTKVQVLDTMNNWKKIELSDGKTGWIMKEDLKMLKNF